ncbi:MAG: dCTP deaminase [Candidatus Babeliales bacterium]
MIISGKEIEQRLGSDIILEPFNKKQLGPNSYNLRLHDTLLIYTQPTLDMKRSNAVEQLTIPAEGFVLQPGILYLGRTVEFTRTENLVPMLEGRSSIGRLGLFIHITAGFGDVGFAGYWTLEMFCVQPIRVYPNVEICQIFYHTIQGDFDRYNSNKYQNNRGIQPSMLFKEFSEQGL